LIVVFFCLVFKVLESSSFVERWLAGEVFPAEGRKPGKIYSQGYWLRQSSGPCFGSMQPSPAGLQRADATISRRCSREPHSYCSNCIVFVRRTALRRGIARIGSRVRAEHFGPSGGDSAWTAQGVWVALILSLHFAARRERVADHVARGKSSPGW